MRGADRSTTPSVRTSTSTVREDSFQSSEVLLHTVLRIATDFCGAMKKAIKTGRATSLATVFIAEPVSALAGTLASAETGSAMKTVANEVALPVLIAFFIAPQKSVAIRKTV